MIYYPRKGMYDVSRDLFKFWEISEYLVNGARYSCNGTLIGNRAWPIEFMAPLPIPLNDIEGHFCCLKPF